MITFLFMIIFLMFFLLYLIHAHEQMTRTHSIGTTGHRQLDLLGYQHPEAVPLFLLNLILCRNPLRRSHLLPQLKVPDFLDMERE